MFCPTCDTLLAPSEEDDKLMEKCSMCGFKKENDKLVIKSTNYKEVVYESVEQNKYLKHDPTLARTTHKTCPNPKCICNIDKSVEHNFIMKQDAKNIKLTYICVHCNSEWKYT